MSFVSVRVPEHYFHRFDAKHRQVFCADVRLALPKLLSSKGEREHADILIGTAEALGLKTPGKMAGEQSFITALPKGKLWLGGSDEAGVRQAVKFGTFLLKTLTKYYLGAADFHIHSNVSDGFGTPEELPQLAHEAGLNIIALTDHDTDAGFERFATAAAKIPGLLAIHGTELNDRYRNHVLAIGGSAQGLSRLEPETLILEAEKRGLFLAEAHATSRAYFRASSRYPRMIATEAFNYLSSAPQASRDYLESNFDNNVAALGNSDTHMTADIGRARTYLLLPHWSVDAVMHELGAGRTCARCRGTLCGTPKLKKFIARILRESDFLDPMPLLKRVGKGEKLALSAVYQFDRRHVYCPVDDECDCKEFHYVLPHGSKTVTVGKRLAVDFTLNGTKRRVTVPQGECFDLTPYLNKQNRFISGFSIKGEGPKLAVGRKITDFTLQRPGKEERISFKAGSNFQILGLIPYGAFDGIAVIRAEIDNPEKYDRLFFESIDGNVEIFVNGIRLVRRFGTHWEERFDIAVPPEPHIELEIRMRNHVGLCGISNHVYLGRCYDLPAKVAFAKCDFAELRYGEPRTRAFLLDNTGKIVSAFFCDGLPHTIPDHAKTIVLTGFETPENTPFISQREQSR